MVVNKERYSEYIDENHFEAAFFSTLGSRDDQQDSLAYQFDDETCFVAVCDGMGGHAGGNIASQKACGNLEASFKNIVSAPDLNASLIDCIKKTDDEICGLIDEQGNELRAGTTLVSMWVRDYKMYWSNCGDSRLYIIRQNKIIQVTRDHNYKLILDDKKAKGTISEKEYIENSSKEDALISFVGMGSIELIDVADKAIELENEDRIFMCTDGLYRLLKDETILEIINNFSNIEEALQALNFKARAAAKMIDVQRDNTSMALIRIKL